MSIPNTERLKKHFWPSVAKAIKSLQKIFSHTHEDLSFQNQPLWYNPCITIELFKKWDKLGLRVVKGVIDTNG